MKTNGHRPNHRNKWLLVSLKIVTRQELLLFDYYVDQMDFDTNHVKFGTFEDDPELTAGVLGYSGANSVTQMRKQLLTVGLINRTSWRATFAVSNPKRYVSPSPVSRGEASQFSKFEKNQTIDLILHNFGIKSQIIEQVTQNIDFSKNKYLESFTSKALGSFKVDQRFVDDINESIEISRKLNLDSVYNDDDKP